MDMGPDTPFDPSTLSPDDPLRDTSVQDWMEKLKADHPDIAGKLITDPQGAVQELANRGVAPPPMSFANPDGFDPAPGALPAPITGQNPDGFDPLAPSLGPRKVEGRVDPTASQGPFRLDGGLPTGPRQTPEVAPVVVPPSSPSPSALDPEENPNPVAPGSVPLPTPREPATDIGAEKKKKDSDSGASEFAKMMGALKPVQPPALAAVGTPGVRSPSPSGAPNVAALLNLLGQQSTPSPVNTLGRLLVAGKA